MCSIALVWAATGAAGCDTHLGVAPCDIRQDSCQDEIFYAVQRVRGVPWDPWLDRPAMRTITDDDYLQELLDAEARSKAAAAKLDEPPFDHYTAALELLRMVDPDRAPTAEAETRVGNVAAFYAYADKQVTIIDNGEPMTPEWATQVLAHELVHAAQDRELDLSTYALANTFDGSLARQAIVEGEARLYELLVAGEAQGVALKADDFDYYHAGVLARAKQRVFADPSPAFQVYGLLYPLGARFLTDRYLEGGNVAVRNVWARLPRQVRALLAQQEWTPLDPGDRTPLPPASGFGCQLPDVPDELVISRNMQMGALYLYAAATRLFDNLEDAWEAARAWKGDQLVVYGNEDDETLLVWHVRLEQERRPTFVAAAEAFYGPEAVGTRGSWLSIILSSDEGAELSASVEHTPHCSPE